MLAIKPNQPLIHKSYCETKRKSIYTDEPLTVEEKYEKRAL